MAYKVIQKDTGEEVILNPIDVNDMVVGSDGRIIVFDTNMTAYLLHEEEESL